MRLRYITAVLLGTLIITACGQSEVPADKPADEEIRTVELDLDPGDAVTEAAVTEATVTEAKGTEATVTEATATEMAAVTETTATEAVPTEAAATEATATEATATEATVTEAAAAEAAVTEGTSTETAAAAYSDGTRFGSLDPASDRVTVQNGFYYESLQPEVMAYIKGVSYPAEDTDVISPGDFRYVHVLHIGADGNVHSGELIVNKKIAGDITDIFIKLYEAGYGIEKIKLIDEYNGDDDLSVQDNNTSSFNFRFVAGSKHLSKHSLGMAIDINPLYNPYIVNGKVAEWGAPYTDRTKDFPYKMTKDDLCVKLFKQHGFKWGGDCWKNTLDYQHFEKN